MLCANQFKHSQEVVSEFVFNYGRLYLIDILTASFGRMGCRIYRYMKEKRYREIWGRMDNCENVLLKRRSIGSLDTCQCDKIIAY